MKGFLVGGSYTSQAVNADCQKTLGWYPERDESGQGKSQVMLYPVPGLKLFAALPGEVEVLGEWEFNGRVFAAGNNSFYELFPIGTVQKRGDFTAGVANGNPVIIRANQANQMLIAAGGNLYLFRLDTNNFAPVDMTQLRGPVDHIDFSDTYFVSLIRNSNFFQLSNLLDGTTWDGTMASAVEVFPENVVSMIVSFREIWLLGGQHNTAYEDTGDVFPYAPIPSAYMEQGCGAEWATVNMDNTAFWIGQDQRGNAMAWRANGYTPLRISNHAIEFAWSQYPRINDAVAYAYQDQGHTFWVIYFPSGNATWVYDAATNMWHERAFWDAPTGRFTAHRSRCHTFGFGKHLVGDWKTGNIYEMSIAYQNDFGSPIRRIRRAPHLSNEDQWNFHHSLQVDMESGVQQQGVFTGQEPATTFTLADDLGNLWLVGVNDAGNLTSTPIVAGIVQNIGLNDPSNSTSWQLGIQSGSGNITATQLEDGGFDVGEFDVILFDSGGTAENFPTSLNLVSQTGTNRYVVTITITGILQTTSRGPIRRGPLMSLRWSDDGGHTWSNYYTRDAGQVGEYRKRVIWRRLGRTRDRVYELSTSDDFAARVIDGYLKAS